MNGVDTLVVYSVSYPGYSETDSDSCSTMYPVNSYFFWKQRRKYLVKQLKGKCQDGQFTTNDKVIRFALDNFSNMTDEFFMSVTYGVVADRGKFLISGSIIYHEPKYQIFIQIGDKFKHLNFADSELTDKKSLFYDYNHNLTSYKLFRLIETQIKKE